MLTPQEIQEKSIVGKKVRIELDDEILFPEGSPALIFEVPQIHVLQFALMKMNESLLKKGFKPDKDGNFNFDAEKIEFSVEDALKISAKILAFCHEIAPYVVDWDWPGAGEYNLATLLKVFEVEEALADAFHMAIKTLYESASSRRESVKKSSDITPNGGVDFEAVNNV